MAQPSYRFNIGPQPDKWQEITSHFQRMINKDMQQSYADSKFFSGNTSGNAQLLRARSRAREQKIDSNLVNKMAQPKNV